MSEDRKTVSLVLGSGGARGLAHIGVIEWLDEHDYEIRSISGCSSGAMVGGVHAAGKLGEFTRWVTALDRLDVFRLLDLAFNRSGLFKGERVIEVLRELVGELDIEDLPVPFTAIATELANGREVWLDRGPLFDAIRASIAFPTIFTPHTVAGRRLVDGGLVNPVPIGPTLRDDTDLTVAVNPSSFNRPRQRRSERSAAPSPEADESYRSRIARFIRELGSGDDDGDEEADLSLFDVVTRSIDTMQNLVARHRLASQSPDVLIDIPRDACMIYEFHRAEEMIELGRETAQAALGER